MRENRIKNITGLQKANFWICDPLPDPLNGSLSLECSYCAALDDCWPGLGTPRPSAVPHITLVRLPSTLGSDITCHTSPTCPTCVWSEQLPVAA